MIDRLDKLKSDQARFIADIEAKYAQEAVRLQKRLMTYLNEDLMSRLDISNGQILNNQYNYNVIYDFETLWDEYSRGYFTPTIRNIANDALKVTSLSNPYFKELGLTGSNAVKLFNAATKNVELMMGIERADGVMRFIKGGYMDRLLQGAEVKDSVMSILADSVSVKTDFKELLTTMRGAVEGSAEVDGAMQRYFRGYVYDTFTGVQAAYDNYVSEAAGMDYFVYAGTEIKSTREFCRDHLNQVYHRDDIAEFEAQDWGGKNPDVPFVISRGGYNCRHSLRWIPDELVETFGGVLDKTK